MTTIPNGVDARFSPPPASEIDRMRNALDLPDRPYLLSLSALQPRKNVQRLLHAWREMRPRLSEPVTLVLAGGAGRPTIFHGFSLDSIPDDVVFTEYVDDALLPALYGGAQAFVYPSLYEGFGLPVLEAMACGTPVVTSNVTSMPEIAGDAALLVSPFSVSSIADGLYAILTNTDLRDRLRERGRERAASFSWETTASETLALLQSKSGSRRPSASTK
jgi:glycosyltransferase involved in cell wall biosynthesis